MALSYISLTFSHPPDAKQCGFHELASAITMEDWLMGFIWILIRPHYVLHNRSKGPTLKKGLTLKYNYLNEFNELFHFMKLIIASFLPFQRSVLYVCSSIISCIGIFKV